MTQYQLLLIIVIFAKIIINNIINSNNLKDICHDLFGRVFITPSMILSKCGFSFKSLFCSKVRISQFNLLDTNTIEVCECIDGSPIYCIESLLHTVHRNDIESVLKAFIYQESLKSLISDIGVTTDRPSIISFYPNREPKISLATEITQAGIDSSYNKIYKPMTICNRTKLLSSLKEIQPKTRLLYSAPMGFFSEFTMVIPDTYSCKTEFYLKVCSQTSTCNPYPSFEWIENNSTLLRIGYSDGTSESRTKSHNKDANDTKSKIVRMDQAQCSEIVIDTQFFTMKKIKQYEEDLHAKLRSIQGVYQSNKQGCSLESFSTPRSCKEYFLVVLGQPLELVYKEIERQRQEFSVHSNMQSLIEILKEKDAREVALLATIDEQRKEKEARETAFLATINEQHKALNEKHEETLRLTKRVHQLEMNELRSKLD